MAGGKETPRQKMIGMMYLVLTALLALQVSNAVLEKFAIIHSTLETFISAGNADNAKILEAIVKEAGNSTRPQVVRARDNAQKLRELTATTLAKIETLKKRIFEMSGSQVIDERIINDHSSKVATMMIDKTRADNEGKGFEKLLNDYVAELNKLSGLSLEKIAKAPKEMKEFKNDTDHANKDFLTFTFENTPPIAALASITQFQTEIMEYEAKALAKLQADAGVGTITFDTFIPMVVPTSSIVAAGAKYEAKLFLTGSSTAITPEFYRDGAKLQVVDEAGVKMGKVEFTASGGAYDKFGMARKTFKSKIQLPDTAFERDIEYFVARPVIKVTTGNVPTLYMNCGNSVNIEVPALGTNYKPSYKANGAEVITGDGPGKVIIVPSQRKFKVSVSSSGTFIDDQDFEAKPIPKARLVAKESSGKVVNMKDGVKGTTLANLRIVAEAEENFKQEVPKDAVYRIRSMNVIHARGTAPVNQGTFTNESLELGAWRAGFRPGDFLVIEVKTVTRKTYKGGDEKADIVENIMRIPIM